MTDSTPARPVEPRWLAIICLIGLLGVLAALPARVRMYPQGVPLAAVVVGIIPMVAVHLTGGAERWLRLERLITVLLFTLAEAANLAGLVFLVGAMINRPAEVTGVQLLVSSMAVWVTNVLAFALIYWQLDRGGPGARVARAPATRHWVFQEEGVARDEASDWQPEFVQYFYLAFTAAASFGSGYALPLTGRAKALAISEGTISLLATVVVAARAVNILNN